MTHPKVRHNLAGQDLSRRRVPAFQHPVPAFDRRMVRVETTRTFQGRPVVFYIERPRTRWLALAGWTLVILTPIASFVFIVGAALSATVNAVTSVSAKHAGVGILVAVSLLVIVGRVVGRRIPCSGLHCQNCGKG
jgi:hypothetical protein